MIRVSGILWLVFLLAGCADERRHFDGAVLVLEGVTVIDGTGQPPQPDQTVVVRDDRIVAIGAAGDFVFGEDQP